MTAPMATAHGLLGGVRQRLQPESRNVQGGVDIAVQVQAAAGTVVDPLRERHFLAMPAAATVLAGVGGVHRDQCPTRACSTAMTGAEVAFRNGRPLLISPSHLIRRQRAGLARGVSCDMPLKLDGKPRLFRLDAQIREHQVKNAARIVRCGAPSPGLEIAYRIALCVIRNAPSKGRGNPIKHATVGVADTDLKPELDSAVSTRLLEDGDAAFTIHKASKICDIGGTGDHCHLCCLVGEVGNELPPRRIMNRLGKTVIVDHALDGQVLDTHTVICTARTCSATPLGRSS